MKFVITSKWVTAPTFSVQLWDFSPGVATDAATFGFTPPEGSTEVDPLTQDGGRHHDAPEPSRDGPCPAPAVRRSLLALAALAIAPAAQAQDAQDLANLA